MSQQVLRVAIVGCGWASDWHVRDGFAHLPHQFSLVACCDSNEEKLNQFGDRYGVAKRTTSFESILGMKDVQVVVICTPPSAHHAMMMAALEAEKYVVCEKPLTSSLLEVDEAIRTESLSRGRVMPVFQYRFGDGLAKVRHVIRSGIAGKAYLSTVETAKKRGPDYYSTPWRGKFASELGGVLLTQAIHSHDLLLWLMGPVAQVSAVKTTRVNPIEVEDCAAASLVMADGSIASLAATLGSMRELVRFRLCFENVTFERQAFDKQASAPAEEPWTVIAKDSVYEKKIAELMDEVPKSHSGFVRQYELFYEAYQKGTPMPVTLEDARRSIELITAMFDSAETGRAVSIPLGSENRLYCGWAPSPKRPVSH
jgi:predicted dehydrogenase